MNYGWTLESSEKQEKEDQTKYTSMITSVVMDRNKKQI